MHDGTQCPGQQCGDVVDSAKGLCLNGITIDFYDDVFCPLQDCLSVLGSGTRISPAAGTDFYTLTALGLLSDVPLIFLDGFEGD